MAHHPLLHTTVHALAINAPDSILDNTEHATELSEPLTEAVEFLAATSVDVSLRLNLNSTIVEFECEFGCHLCCQICVDWGKDLDHLISHISIS